MNVKFNKLELMRRYEREILRIQKLSQSTFNTYSERLNNFFWWCDNRNLNPIDINDQEHIKEYLSQFNSANTISHALSALKIFYDDVLNLPLVVRFIKYPKKEQKLPIILSREEIVMIYNNIGNIKQKFIFLLLYSTGMRKSEVENLEEKDFDFDRDILIIRSAKGGKDRLVSLDKIIKDKFMDYKKYREQEIKKFNFTPKYFFVGQFGGKYKSVNAFLKTAAKKAGVSKRVYEHLIRHCFGTHMREKMIDIATIGELMGHEPNSKTTFLYAKLTNATLNKVGTPLSNLQLK